MKGVNRLKTMLLKKGIDDKEVLKCIDDIESLNKCGVIWEEKEEDKYLELLESLPILEEVFEKEIKTGSTDVVNLLIEGDNLHSLKSLQYTHKNLIDLIYIDPPYNLGNKDFVYNDNYIDKEDSWRHSKWLSFMDKRLKLAKELLSDDGVIFISIDDTEVAHLKLLCNDIFGENNFEAMISYVRKTSGKQDSSNFVNSTEYILIYSKNSSWRSNRVIAGDKINKRYNKIDSNGKLYREVDLRKTGTGDRMEDSPTLYYPLYVHNGEVSLEKKSEDDIEILPIKVDGAKGRWRWGKEAITNKSKNLIAHIMPKYKKENKWTVYEKDYIDKNEEVRTILEHTCWDRKEFNSDNATSDFVSLGFNNKEFSYPKSVALLKHIVYLGAKKNSICLDFFCGSGTFGQAIMELNSEDNGNRQYILCTNNENNICENITYKRVLNASQIYGGTNLKYYKVKLENKYEDIDDNIENLISKADELIKIKEKAFDIVEEDEKYVIIQNCEKTVLVYKEIFPLSKDIKEIAKKLNGYNTEKILYCIEKNCKIKNIEIKEYPKEILDRIISTRVL